MKSRKIGPWLVFIAGVLWLQSAVWAVHPVTWRFNSEKAYSTGKFTATEVNNYGQLFLGRTAVKLVKKPAFGFVNAMVQTKNGDIFWGTTAPGKVWVWAAGKAQPYYSVPGTDRQVLSLAVGKRGHVLAGISGQGPAKLVRLTQNAGGKVVAQSLFHRVGVKYIWAIHVNTDGSMYLATGPTGELWKISRAGKASLVLKTGTKNILAMVQAAHQNLVVGTDSPGLVIRVNERTGKPFVLLSAGAAEIDALAVDPSGDIFAATASPLLARIGAAVLSMQADLAGMGRPALVHGGKVLDAGLHKGKGHVAPKPAKARMGRLPPRSHPLPLPFPSVGNVKSNVVYQITPTGRASILLHVPDMILSMVYQDGKLLLGLGGHGRLLQYDPFTQTETLVTRLTQMDILSLLAGRHGGLYLGTANGGQVLRLSGRAAASGTYVSRVLDAKLPANWGVAHLQAAMPVGTRVTIRTRSGNVKNVKTLGRFWSAWSAAMPANTWRKMSSPAARYLQFKIHLMANKAGQSPVVDAAGLVYQQITVPPQINSVMAVPVAGDSHLVKIKWSATDANGDSLQYRLEYRQKGIPVWIGLVKHLTDTDYLFKTNSVPSGKYRVKVIASNAADNSPQETFEVARETRYFVVENAPPVISGLKAKVLPDQRVVVTGFVHSRRVPVVAVAFQVDSGKYWQPAAASDKIFDAPLEGFSARTGKLAAGPHRITIRAVDAKGNKTYKSVMVTVH
jgi:hypothetical protein